MGLEVIFPDGRQEVMRFPDDRQSPGHDRDLRLLREPGSAQNLRLQETRPTVIHHPLLLEAGEGGLL